jgi:hypothetical protein
MNEWLIHFLCHPDFDWPTVFAALLADAPGGAFRLDWASIAYEFANCRQRFM